MASADRLTVDECLLQWKKGDAVHPFSAGGAYVNLLMDDEGKERVKKTYGCNYERLGAIKMKYHSDNFFRVNQNIKPSLITCRPARVNPPLSLEGERIEGEG